MNNKERKLDKTNGGPWVPYAYCTEDGGYARPKFDEAYVAHETTRVIQNMLSSVEGNSRTGK